MKITDINMLSADDYILLRKAILQKLKKRLTTKRFDHTLRVEETASTLAKRFSGNRRKVEIAALLHDYAKNYTDSEKLILCKKLHLELSNHEQNNLDLVHSKLGAELAREKFFIYDTDILDAIKYHTTGRPHMSLTEKIIFIADYIEPGRKMFDELAQVRQAAEVDLHSAIVKKLVLTIKYLIDRGQYIDPITRETYEYYFDLHTTHK